MIDFDLDNFPYVVVNGEKSCNLINMKTKQMTQLVETPVRCHSGMTAMFFLRTERGYILHFTTREADHKNQSYTNWFTLPLHEDAVDCLKTIGRLPPTTTREFIEACSKATKYE